MNKPEFAPEYFYDEVREGFYIPEMMKRFWAAQLAVLYEIVKICDRHDIKWYIDMGTLLGAVRHKGYVPWDDDLDISMNREDWERFFEYAKSELPEEFVLLSLRTEPAYRFALGRIVNSRGINTGEKHLKAFYGCPYCVGVDVFPMDRLYKDPEKEQERKQRAKAVGLATKLIEKDGAGSEEVRKLLADIERANHTVLHRKGDICRELRLLFEKISMECKDEDYEEVALMVTWLIHDWENVPKECYGEQREFAFENLSLKGPVEYDKLLSIHYRDYMTIRKGGGAHGYPVYKEQEDTLRAHPEQRFYRYTFERNAEKLLKTRIRHRDRWNEMIGLLMDASEYCEKCKDDERSSLLQGCQETAIALGTSIEEIYGEGTEAVRTLEEYCELLYQAAEEWQTETAGILKEKIRKTEEELELLINERVKDVLFLAFRKEWWDTMKPLYERLLADPEMNVHLTSLPYYDKDPFGNIGQKHDDSAFFSGIAGYMDLNENEKAAVHPGIIVTQMPFDEYSGAITTDEKFYSAKLIDKTDDLWYVPCFDPEPPMTENDKAYSALEPLVEQPAMVYADKVILSSEELRTFYIKKLIELTGEENRDYWESKIEVL